MFHHLRLKIFMNHMFRQLVPRVTGRATRKQQLLLLCTQSLQLALLMLLKLLLVGMAEGGWSSLP